MKEIKENEYLRPFVKWAGGKEQELSYILPLLPKKIADLLSQTEIYLAHAL